MVSSEREKQLAGDVKTRGMGDCPCHLRAYGDCTCGKGYRLPEPTMPNEPAASKTTDDLPGDLRDWADDYDDFDRRAETLKAGQVGGGAVMLRKAADEIERLRAALRMIAGEAVCVDLLLGNADIARIALHGK